MIYIKRKIEQQINKYLNNREILAIIGPRQSGKTTLLKKIQTELKNSIYLSFEDREELELFEQDIKTFAQQYMDYKYIFIDEFQYSMQGGKQLKYLYDTYPKNKIIISGSSSIDLTIRALKYLVGRVFVFQLYQFDFEEYLQTKNSKLLKLYQNIKKDLNIFSNNIKLGAISQPVNIQLQKALNDFIIWGGYPRVVLAKNKEEKITILKNVFNTYFLRDIKDVLGLIDDFKLSKLIKALATQIGQLIEYNELSNITGYDNITLKKYINILEKTFICKTIKPYYSNKRTEIVKNPKIYFFDTGLRNIVLDDFRNLDKRVEKGFLYENFVFNQLNKMDLPINYWRTKNQNEIDFITQINNKIIPIEIKSSLNSVNLSKSMISFLDQYNSPTSFVLNEKIFNRIKNKNNAVYFLPSWII